MARIQRKLGKEQRQLRAHRRDWETRYIVVACDDDTLVDSDVDLEKLGRELGVLRPWESMGDD